MFLSGLAAVVLSSFAMVALPAIFARSDFLGLVTVFAFGGMIWGLLTAWVPSFWRRWGTWTVTRILGILVALAILLLVAITWVAFQAGLMAREDFPKYVDHPGNSVEEISVQSMGRGLTAFAKGRPPITLVTLHYTEYADPLLLCEQERAQLPSGRGWGEPTA